MLTQYSTRAGCLLLTHSTTPFHLQPLKDRQTVLQNWSNSYIPALRQGAKLLGSLWKAVWLKTSPAYKQMINFPSAPLHGTPGKGYDYEFLKFTNGDEPATVETDVVIVGSGCGGAVCAKNLAEAGQRVLVAEKGYHFAPEHLPMTEKDGTIHLFQNGGFETSDDASMVLLSGSTWGGGGTVNWSASLQTQDFVRQEWADGGLTFFTSSEFQKCLDRVCSRMGVSTDHIRHNKANSVLMEGSRKLGYNCKAVPQNTGGKQHYCGYCSLGCGSAEKQGPVVSWLPDAAQAGARFMEGFDAEEVLFEKVRGNKTAVGVKGTWRSRDKDGGVSGPLQDRVTRSVIVKAKRVIVSCGSLSSPLLLLRSGLTNPHIGRHLHLHPVNVLFAEFPEEINAWEGGILTTVVDSLQNLDGAGHGSKLEVITMLPSFVLPLFPWAGALEWKQVAARFNRWTGFFSLARDRDTGRVYPDRHDGKARVAYSTSPLDRKHILEGIIALAKIVYVMGATKIMTTTAGIPVFERSTASSATGPDPGINDPQFQAYLNTLRRKGLPNIDASFGSAHQMGSCRMATSARAGVVDPYGQVFGTENLYVADASVFPSASGVNPMVTNMAIADYISRELGAKMRGEARGKEGARL
jgi:choline dehydrogenase-like flavoprotein